MKTIKILLLFVVLASIFTSCAEPKTFKDKNGKEFTAEPFGWVNENAKKIDTVVYQVNVGNIVLDILFSETILIPAVLTGWQFYEPVRLKNENETNQNTGILLGVVLILILYFIWRKI